MKLVLPKFFLDLCTHHAAIDEEEERADVEYIQMAKHDAHFRPLREVLSEIEAKQERGELRGSVRQAL